MAHIEPVISFEVCNNAYEWNQTDMEDGELGPGNEVDNYVDLDYHQRCSPSLYQKIFSRKQNKKASHAMIMSVSVLFDE